jgi:hypothetical protein
MRMLVLYGKGVTFAAPTLDANATKQDEMRGSGAKIMMSTSRRK